MNPFKLILIVIIAGLMILGAYSLYTENFLPEYYHQNGLSLFEKGEYQKAIESLEKAVELHDKHYKYFHDSDYEGALAKAYYAFGDYEKAKEHYNKAIETNRWTNEKIKSEMSILSEQLKKNPGTSKKGHPDGTLE